jgi:SulP family sulfate permease
VYALDKAVIKLRNMGKVVEVIGHNEATQTIIDRFGIHDKPDEIKKMMGGH